MHERRQQQRRDEEIEWQKRRQRLATQLLAQEVNLTQHVELLTLGILSIRLDIDCEKQRVDFSLRCSCLKGMQCRSMVLDKIPDTMEAGCVSQGRELRKVPAALQSFALSFWSEYRPLSIVRCL